MNRTKVSLKLFLASMLMVTVAQVNAKTITFKNNAGYVAELVVMYMQNQQIGNQMVPIPKQLSTGKIAVTQSRTIQLPNNIYEKEQINVWIRGVGTVKQDVMSKTLSPDFINNACYEAKGTIFNASGDYCNGGAPMIKKKVQQQSSSAGVPTTASTGAQHIRLQGQLFQSGAYKLNRNGKFATYEGEIPAGCFGQLMTEMNGDNTVAAIFLNRSNYRGCVSANIPYPGGNANAISYTIKAAYPNDTYHVQVCQSTGGSMGASCSEIQVKFTNRSYNIKGRVSTFVSLEKVGEL